MIRAIAEFLATAISRQMPDAFVYTIVLTFVALAASLLWTPSGSAEVLSYWGEGVSSLLLFSMQMVLVIVAGHAIASSAPAIQFFAFVARQIHSTRQAILVVSVFSLICNWLNPGFGLVASAFFATAVAKHLPQVNIPLLIASCYSGYVIWHAGLSGSIPLKIASPSDDALGLFLHGSPKKYVAAISTASPSAARVILQYPFYGGNMGVMTASGLTSDIANWFVSVSTESSYLLFTFLSAGLLNIFVPSGGGQWVVQGPIAVESAAQLGKPIAHAAMAVAYGDDWTNLIQPFWTLPILAVSGLSIWDIMGYCLLAFLWTGLVFASVLLLLY